MRREPALLTLGKQQLLEDSDAKLIRTAEEDLEGLFWPCGVLSQA